MFIEKNSCVNGPAQLQHVLLKGQLNLDVPYCKDTLASFSHLTLVLRIYHMW